MSQGDQCYRLTASQQDIMNRLPQVMLQQDRMVAIPTEIRAYLDSLCTWEKDDDGIWHAICDRDGKNQFCFNDEGPEANGFKFCPFCGRPMVEVKVQA